MFKQIMIVGLALATAQGAYADPVPPKVQTSLKSFDTATITLEGGTLKTVFNSKIMTQALFQNYIIHGVCSALPVETKVAGKAKGADSVEITQAEAKNHSDITGYALPNIADACGDLAKITVPAEIELYFHRRALICVNGNPCRPRLLGERIPGEQ